MGKRRGLRLRKDAPIGSLSDLYNWAVGQHDERTAKAVVVTFYHEIKKLQYELEAIRRAVENLNGIREAVGGLDLRLQEVEEDLYGK